MFEREQDATHSRRRQTTQKRRIDTVGGKDRVHKAGPARPATPAPGPVALTAER
jgi:hypothetical protein